MAEAPNPENRPLVLVVDDNPQILELVEAYLEPLPIRVRTATDGQGALDLVHTTRPDVILLDIMMPKRSGFEVCRDLKDDPQTKDIPIIMVTALNEEGDLERAKESGADDYVTKPVNKVELIDRLRRLLEQGGHQL